MEHYAEANDLTKINTTLGKGGMRDAKEGIADSGKIECRRSNDVRKAERRKSQITKDGQKNNSKV